MPLNSGEVMIVGGEYALPYSKGLISQSIMATGLAPLRSHELAKIIEAHLLDMGRKQISVDELRSIAEEVIGAEESQEILQRYRNWQRLGKLERPLILMIGGATGTGKSTVATMLANRLAITRVSSTDLIRQVLRAYFSKDFMPAVHYSSFDAAKAVEEILPLGGDPTIRGFNAQAENVLVGVNALIERSGRERTPMILEGVHLVPGLVEQSMLEQALVVHVLLAVRNEDVHRSHYFLRGAAERRPPQHYLKGFDRIRQLQDHLIERAGLEGVTVIDNLQFDRTVRKVLEHVLDAVAKETPAASAINKEQKEGMKI